MCTKWLTVLAVTGLALGLFVEGFRSTHYKLTQIGHILVAKPSVVNASIHNRAVFDYSEADIGFPVASERPKWPFSSCPKNGFSCGTKGESLAGTRSLMALACMTVL
jgi:hypothetical protein